MYLNTLQVQEIQDPVSVFTNIFHLFSLKNKDSRRTNAVMLSDKKKSHKSKCQSHAVFSLIICKIH